MYGVGTHRAMLTPTTTPPSCCSQIGIPWKVGCDRVGATKTKCHQPQALPSGPEGPHNVPNEAHVLVAGGCSPAHVPSHGNHTKAGRQRATLTHHEGLSLNPRP